MDITHVILVAILIEAIWENCKMVWKDGKFNVNMLGVLILSVIVCVAAKIDIFLLVGITLVHPVIGFILTGIVVSRGANFVNDLFKRLQGGN